MSKLCPVTTRKYMPAIIINILWNRIFRMHYHLKREKRKEDDTTMCQTFNATALTCTFQICRFFPFFLGE